MKHYFKRTFSFLFFQNVSKICENKYTNRIDGRMNCLRHAIQLSISVLNQAPFLKDFSFPLHLDCLCMIGRPLKGGVADFEVGLRFQGTHRVSIIPKKNSGQGHRLSGKPLYFPWGNHKFQSLGETTNSSHQRLEFVVSRETTNSSHLGKPQILVTWGNHKNQSPSTRFLYILKQDNVFGTIQERLDRFGQTFFCRLRRCKEKIFWREKTEFGVRFCRQNRTKPENYDFQSIT